MPKGAANRQGLTREIRTLFAKAKLPTNPTIATQVVRLAKDTFSGANDFAKLIRTDPALATRLLKTANSAQFAQRTPVSNIERAVTVLGLNQVKTAVLGFQLVTNLDRLGGVPFDLKAFWQHSLLRACIARSIAQTVVPERQDEAFLIGLLQECGVLLLVQVQGASYASLCCSTLSPAAFYSIEKESFPYTHLDAISVMAAEWKLPEIIAAPLVRHHQATVLSPGCAETDQLSAVAYFVGGLCFAGNSSLAPEDAALRDFGSGTLGLDEASWTLAQKRAADEYMRAAALFGHLIPEEIDISDLLGEANNQLAVAAVESERRALDIARERAAIQRDQRRLSSALSEYRERASLDPLTNLLNRGALTEAARTAIAQHLDNGVPIGALFLDLDNFKRANDLYGHAVGDQILKALASLLGTEIRQRGSVGRYGGEEFVVLLGGLSADAVREIAERIVQRVRELDGRALGCSGVTCSLGALWSDRLPVASAEELFAAADQLMYKAKRAGKDRCCFEVLTGSTPPEAQATSRTESPLPVVASPGTDGAAPPSPQAKMISLAQQLNANEIDGFDGIRKQARKKIVAPCVLHYFATPGSDLREAPAVTRNLSSGGIGLLVGRPMVRGEPVEVELDKASGKLYLAGLVSFCRHLDGKIHEAGVQFVVHSVTPIISESAVTALRHDWVSRALNAKVEGKLEPQFSR